MQIPVNILKTLRKSFLEQKPTLLKGALKLNTKEWQINTFIERRFRRSIHKDNLRVSVNGLPTLDAGMLDEHGFYDSSKLIQLFENKATLIFEKVETYDRSYSKLNKLVSSNLGEETHINAYLSPAHAKGFSCHWDLHDVAVFQIYGSKKWKVWNDPIKNPLHFENFDNLTQNEQEILRTSPYQEFLLEEGDILYFPRGYLHEVETVDSDSLHLTLGINVVTEYRAFEKQKKNHSLIVQSFLMEHKEQFRENIKWSKNYYEKQNLYFQYAYNFPLKKLSEVLDGCKSPAIDRKKVVQTLKSYFGFNKIGPDTQLRINLSRISKAVLVGDILTLAQDRSSMDINFDQALFLETLAAKDCFTFREIEREFGVAGVSLVNVFRRSGLISEVK